MSGFSLSAEERVAEGEEQDEDNKVIELGDNVYVGVFVGSGRAFNEFVDKDGFANWGHPGSPTDYNKTKTVGGALIGERLNINGVPFRIELDGTIGGISASTNTLDPIGLDETVKTDVRWIVTARVGLEKKVGPATLFANSGVAVARVTNSVIDIDFGPNTPRHVDLDDSFKDDSIKIGWVAGVGVEVPLNKNTRIFRDDEGWVLRLEGFYVDLGEDDYEVNHSGGNSCGPDGPHRPCVYNIETKAGVIRLALIRRFSL